jgi:hypothetical protein
MKIVYAFSGDEIAELEDPFYAAHAAKSAASDALGVHPGLLRVTVTQCSVVVLSGKILCRQCEARVACSCRAEDDACRCEVVQADVAEGPVLCVACEELDRQIAEVGEAWQQMREEEFTRW